MEGWPSRNSGGDTETSQPTTLSAHDVTFLLRKKSLRCPKIYRADNVVFEKPDSGCSDREKWLGQGADLTMAKTPI